MQTGVRIPKGFFSSLSDVTPQILSKTLTTPCRLKPATLRTWGVGLQL